MKQTSNLLCCGAGRLRVLLFLLLLMVTGETAYSQVSPALDKRITYKATNKPLALVLKDIRALSNVRFTYNADEVRRQPPVTIDVKSETLERILKTILDAKKLDFVEDMGGIVIYPVTPTQQKTVEKIGFPVRGQVTGPDGNGLPGVSIQAERTKTGTVTTDNGLFSMVIEEGESLRFSLMGMKAVTMKVNTMPEMLKVQMETAPMQVQEVLVNGYQKIDPRLATGATYKIKAADIMQPGVPTVDKMLQGKIPGLMVVNNSGSVNARPTIRMRGTSTFVGNASPLWVIDGMIRTDPVDISAESLNGLSNGNYSLMGNAIAGLNPYDIESITFLRDAAATSIYGVRAANGVIVVTTKRGKAGPANVTYNTWTRFSRRPGYGDLQLMNSAERMLFSQQMVEDGKPVSANGFLYADSYEALVRKLFRHEITEEYFKQKVTEVSSRNTDWFQLLFQNAVSTSHNISVSGGVGNTTYYTSFGFLQDQGVAKLDRNKQFSTSTNINTAIGKRVTLGINILGSYTKKRGYYNGTVSPLDYALKTSRTVAKDDFYEIANATDIPKRYGAEPIKFNIFNELDNTYNENGGYSFSVQVQGRYDIGRGFSFNNQSSVGVNHINLYNYATERSSYIANIRGYNYGETYPQEVLNQSTIPIGGLGATAYTNMFSYSTRNSFNFSTNVRNMLDRVYVDLGTEINSAVNKGLAMQRSGFFPDRGMKFYSSDLGNTRLLATNITDMITNSVGVYLSGGYNYDNRYTLSATVRSDGSNRFGQYSNQKFLPNYSVGFRWDAKSEEWLKESKLIDALFVNASYGTQGNVVNQVGPSLIASYSTNINEANIFNRPGIVLKSLPYPDLRWEKTQQYNLGVNVSVFNNKVNIDFNTYRKKGRDLIVAHNIPYENGVSTNLTNNGVMDNSGYELQLTLIPIQRKNISLSLTFMNNWNINNVRDTGYLNTYNDYLNGTAKVNGRAVDGFYSYRYGGPDPQTGLPTVTNMNDKISSPENFLVYSGQVLPKLTGTFSFTFRYRNLSLSSDFYYAVGNKKRMNGLYQYGNNRYPSTMGNMSREMLDRWRKPGDELYTKIPAAVDLFSQGTIEVPMANASGAAVRINRYDLFDFGDLMVADGSFLRCNVINLGYMVPQSVVKQLKLKGLQLGAGVRTPFKIKARKLKGQDPEIDGVGSTALPVVPEYTGSISVTF